MRSYKSFSVCLGQSDVVIDKAVMRQKGNRELYLKRE